jgi:hypothetical protein
MRAPMNAAFTLPAHRISERPSKRLTNTYIYREENHTCLQQLLSNLNSVKQL